MKDPRELLQLKGVGATTVSKIEAKLKTHLKNNPSLASEYTFSGHKSAASKKTVVAETVAEGEAPSSSQPTAAKKRKTSTKAYVPAFRSGAYALLIALHQSGRTSVTKEQLIVFSQPYCDASFTIPERNSFYTAWKSMNTLIEK
jgi:crossover junction endonuclease MUS81